MIGIGENQRNNQAKEIFEQEAAEISSYLRGVHHSRKIAHQQVNYADTVSKLGKFQQEVPVYLQKTEAPSFSASQGFGNTEKGFRMQEYTNKMGTYILSEKDMNDRKRLFNREAGRKAIVNEVISGTAEIPKKQLLFPHKATHTQILALAGTLKAPDARIVPPRIARGKKWLGDGVGWDS
eukprot:CAMPEP_0184969370 /NCGR_PEP_ID=MMETSP1098-20130426/2132_1 /TAXON_ID=89044 /ORGANISM="Spumella elongata, Strain CCAP 955/1" /LENGTH=179 /DNA_ID=CAMNT_0027491123 /DNA_START=81 /DNA_END=620 /DNA_ORIENTATION=+